MCRLVPVPEEMLLKKLSKFSFPYLAFLGAFKKKLGTSCAPLFPIHSSSPAHGNSQLILESSSFLLTPNDLCQ
jgi:hypothetical protein